MANFNEQFNKVASINAMNFPHQGISQVEKLGMLKFSIPPPPLPHTTCGYFPQNIVAQNDHMGCYQFQNIPPNMSGENINTTLHFPYPQYVGHVGQFPPPSNMPNIYNPRFPPPQGYFARCNLTQFEPNNFSQGHKSWLPPIEEPSENVGDNLNSEVLQQQRMQDELWVKDFLIKIGPQEMLKPSIVHHEESVKELKIFEAQQKFKIYVNLLQELQMMQKEIAAKCGSLSLEAWERKCEHIEIKKTEINKYVDELCNPVMLETLKKKLDRRKRKRQAEKRRRAERQSKAVKAHVHRQKLHKDIDSWLEEMKESVEKSKREESLKYDADLVLFDVTRKKTEAKRQVTLLTNLIKLRQLKAQAAASKGQHVSPDSADSFEKPIEHLCKLWKDQLKDYSFEEQGLRVMLEEAAEERNKKHLSHEKKACIEWERTLFGDKIYWDDEDAYNSISAANNSLEAFMNVRKSWDKFVVPKSTITSSSMPAGWVVPAYPSSSAWQAVTHEALHNIPTSAIPQTTSQL